MIDTVLEKAGLAVETEEGLPRTYRDLLRAADLTKGELKDLHEMHDGRAVLHFGGVLATTACVPLVYLAYPGPLTAVLCVLLALHNFNTFAQIVHGSGHGKLLRNGYWNDLVGEIAAGFLGFRRLGAALAHQMHHSKLNTEEDGDRIWGRPEQTTGEFCTMLLQDVLMISALKRVLQYLQFDRKGYTTRPWQALGPRFFAGKLQKLLPILAIQLALLAYYWAVLGPAFYLYFYILPILTVYPALIRLRTACEHAFDGGYRPRTAEERWVTRSTRANLFERLVVAPALMPFHFEHHLLPAVPYYNLPAVQKLLATKGFEVPMAPGYFAFMYRRWRRERGAAG